MSTQALKQSARNYLTREYHDAPWLAAALHLVNASTWTNRMGESIEAKAERLAGMASQNFLNNRVR